MATKGLGGARRWIRRRPIDSRPIVGMNERGVPAWLRTLEAVAPWGCFGVAAATVALAAWAWSADLFAGHLG